MYIHPSQSFPTKMKWALFLFVLLVCAFSCSATLPEVYRLRRCGLGMFMFNETHTYVQQETIDEIVERMGELTRVIRKIQKTLPGLDTCDIGPYNTATPKIAFLTSHYEDATKQDVEHWDLTLVG